jgi:hypothetical protein
MKLMPELIEKVTTEYDRPEVRNLPVSLRYRSLNVTNKYRGAGAPKSRGSRS